MSSGIDMDLHVRIGSLELPNPVIAASGCFGYGVEYEEAVDLSLLGGVAVLFVLGIQGFILALVGEYLGRIQHGVENRPLYTIDKEI